MKAKFTAAMILSAMLLTACNSGNQSADNIPAEAEGTETISQTVTTASETETTASETTTVTTSETAEETTTAAETMPPKIENISENVTLDIKTIDISNIINNEYYYDRLFFWGDVTAIGTYGNSSTDKICFFDMNDQTVKGKITPPDNWDFAWYYHCIKGSGDILCKIELSRYNYEQDERENAVLVVHNDFSTEIIENEKIAIPVGNHNISDTPYNIYDTDSGEV
ncbi:MAG: hypothetical protein K2N71_11775, partial [Oscillospiraceae bacterium]|nr:hypothetical protein [Oscillospiraceae bacterium]